jgi:hypothetical protein
MLHSIDTVPLMAQYHHKQDSFDEDYLDYLSDKLIEQHDNSFCHFSSFVADTEASM